MNQNPLTPRKQLSKKKFLIVLLAVLILSGASASAIWVNTTKQSKKPSVSVTNNEPSLDSSGTATNQNDTTTENSGTTENESSTAGTTPQSRTQPGTQPSPKKGSSSSATPPPSGTTSPPTNTTPPTNNPPSSPAPTPPVTGTNTLFHETFEGRGQGVGQGTYINSSNSYASVNGIAGLPPVAFFHYASCCGTNRITSPSNANEAFVLPQFDSSTRQADSYSGRFGMLNIGQSNGGSYFMHRNDSSPETTMNTEFWWRFNDAAAIPSGRFALFSVWTGGGAQDLLYLWFNGNRQLYYTDTVNWTHSSYSPTLTANTWYRLRTSFNTNTDTASLSTYNSGGSQVGSTINNPMRPSSGITMFEFGALQAQPISNLSTNPASGGAVWYDNFHLTR